MERKTEIFCPSCEWRPQPEDRWACVHPCDAVWNTFWTRGVCPGSGVKWPLPQCLVCGEWAAHEAWYHRPPSAEREESEAQEQVGSGT